MKRIFLTLLFILGFQSQVSSQCLFGQCGFDLAGNFVVTGNWTFSSPGIVTFANGFTVTAGTVSISVPVTITSTLEVTIADAATNSITNVLKVGHTTSGAAVAGFGLKVEYELEENDGTNKNALEVDIKWDDAGETTDADSHVDFSIFVNDVLTPLLTFDGTAGRVGINDVTPDTDFDVEGNISAKGTGYYMFGADTDRALREISTNSLGIRANDFSLALGGSRTEFFKFESTGAMTQETFVIRKHVALSGATDNTATNFFTVTTTDETGSADGGSYSVSIHLMVNEAGAASGAVNTASKSTTAHFARIMASAGTGANSAMGEISETDSANEGTGAITTVTLTIVETSEFIQTIQLLVNTSGGTFDGFALIELVYSDFTTAPVIAGI